MPFFILWLIKDKYDKLLKIKNTADILLTL